MELDNDLVYSTVLSSVEEEGCSKKKLRLSREQCGLLEEIFLPNKAPEPDQKQALALQLNLHLRPRQVEVWFQNRRARTKVKQTDVDCELMKRCNGSLVEENRKLHKELENLRALKISSTPAATLTMCPSCERISDADTNSHFTLAKVKSMFMRGAH